MKGIILNSLNMTFNLKTVENTKSKQRPRLGIARGAIVPNIITIQMAMMVPLQQRSKLELTS